MPNPLRELSIFVSLYLTVGSSYVPYKRQSQPSLMWFYSDFVSFLRLLFWNTTMIVRCNYMLLYVCSISLTFLVYQTVSAGMYYFCLLLLLILLLYCCSHDWALVRLKCLSAWCLGREGNYLPLQVRQAQWECLPCAAKINIFFDIVYRLWGKNYKLDRKWLSKGRQLMFYATKEEWIW